MQLQVRARSSGRSRRPHGARTASRASARRRAGLGDLAGDQSGHDGCRERRTAPAGHAGAEHPHVALVGALVAHEGAVGEGVDDGCGRARRRRRRRRSWRSRRPGRRGRASRRRRPSRRRRARTAPPTSRCPRRRRARSRACAAGSGGSVSSAIDGQVQARAAAGRQVDDLRVVRHRLLQLRRPGRTPGCRRHRPRRWRSPRRRRRSSGAMQRTTPAMNVPWPAYGRRSGPLSSSSPVDAVQPRRARVGARRRVPPGVDDHDADVARPLVLRGAAAATARSGRSPRGSIGRARGAAAAAPGDDVDPVVGRGRTAGAARPPRAGRARRAPTRRRALGQHVAHAARRRGAYVVDAAACPSRTPSSSRGDRALEARRRPSRPHQHAVGVEQVGEVGRRLGVPGDLRRRWPRGSRGAGPWCVVVGRCRSSSRPWRDASPPAGLRGVDSAQGSRPDRQGWRRGAGRGGRGAAHPVRRPRGRARDAPRPSWCPTPTPTSPRSGTRWSASCCATLGHADQALAELRTALRLARRSDDAERWPDALATLGIVAGPRPAGERGAAAPRPRGGRARGGAPRPGAGAPCAW